MSDRDDYIDAIDSLVGGTVPLVEADKIQAINTALKLHSRQKPLVVVEDVDGDGGFDYAVSDLASWSTGFSVIKTVEYPVDDDDETPDVLQDDQWIIYEKPAGKFLRFLEDKPAADEDIRVAYTALHTCTALACSVDDFDEQAVQMLCASIFCDMLATYFAQTQDSTIAADSVDHNSKAREYAARAKTYRKQYFDHLGIKEGQVTAASVTRDQDAPSSHRADKLTHPSRYR